MILEIDFTHALFRIKYEDITENNRRLSLHFVSQKIGKIKNTNLLMLKKYGHGEFRYAICTEKPLISSIRTNI